MKKYEFTGEEKVVDNHTLHRIRAMRDFGIVKAGDLGGWIESEDNLSHDGYAWVGDDALVTNKAWVANKALVAGDARVTGKALVTGDARVICDAWVGDEALVTGKALVTNKARVTGKALVAGDARVTGKTLVAGDARITGDARVTGEADYAVVRGFGRFLRSTTFFRCQDGKIRTRCGCFYGDLDEFRAKVKETHGESKMAKEYLMIADLMEMHFASEE